MAHKKSAVKKVETNGCHFPLGMYKKVTTRQKSC